MICGPLEVGLVVSWLTLMLSHYGTEYSINLNLLLYLSNQVISIKLLRNYLVVFLTLIPSSYLCKPYFTDVLDTCNLFRWLFALMTLLTIL